MLEAQSLHVLAVLGMVLGSRSTAKLISHFCAQITYGNNNMKAEEHGQIKGPTSSAS